MNGKRTVNFRAALAGMALAACTMPGSSVAQSSYYEYRSGPAYPGTSSETHSYSYSESGPDYPPNRDGYGTSSNPYYSQPGDPNYSDYRDRPANAASRHGTVEAIEIVREGGHSSGAGTVLGARA